MLFLEFEKVNIESESCLRVSGNVEELEVDTDSVCSSLHSNIGIS